MVKEVRYLLGLSCAALLAGCYNPGEDRAHYSTHQSYTDTSGTTEMSTETDTTRSYRAQTGAQSQGGTGSQSQQLTGSGEIQSERMVIPLHEEQVQVGKRIVDAGTVRLRKQIVTETVNQPVQIRRETIVVDREAVGGTGSAQSFESGSGSSTQQFQNQSGSFSQPFGEGEIVVRLQREEPVIEKRIVPAGNIVVQTRTDTEQVNVQQQVRRETIDVDKGQAQNVIVSENLNQPAGTRSAVGASQREPQRYQETTTTTNRTTTDTEYRTPVTTREEGFPRPQPDGRETFPELKKDPERR